MRECAKYAQRLEGYWWAKTIIGSHRAKSATAISGGWEKKTASPPQPRTAKPI